jgi:hypothetical protein
MQLLLLPFIVLYVLVIGQNWAIYAAAVMIAAIVKDMRARQAEYVTTAPEHISAAHPSKTHRHPAGVPHVTP